MIAASYAWEWPLPKKSKPKKGEALGLPLTPEISEYLQAGERSSH